MSAPVERAPGSTPREEELTLPGKAPGTITYQELRAGRRHTGLLPSVNQVAAAKAAQVAAAKLQNASK